MTTVGAVVVDYGSGFIVKRCIDALLEDGVDQVVVVDNGKADGLIPSENWLRALKGSKVEIVASKINLGYGSGVNQGASQLNCDYLIVCNADVVIDKGAVSLMLENFKDDQVAIVGPKIVTDHGWYPSARKFPSVLQASGHAIIGKLKPDNRFSKTYLGHELINAKEPVEVDWVSGSIMLIKKTIFDEILGFDPRYYLFLEDVDICFRVKKLGAKVIYDPRASVYHVQGLSRAIHPYKSIVAHHISAMRFEWRYGTKFRKLAFPFAVVLLVLRGAAELMAEFLREKLSPPEVDKIA
jgi:N-acetylglucosaminyl-diphospho-decaprenol L-rhamnosyltransferase